MGRRKVEINAQELRKLCDSGMTEYELAEYFGCSRRVLGRRKHEYGIIYGRGHAPSNIKANHDPSRRDMGKRNVRHLCNDPIEKREADFIERLASDPRTQMYEYVGGYKTKRDKLTIRCKKCGDYKQTTPAELFSSKYDHHRCFGCERVDRERRKAEKAAQYDAFCAIEYAKDKVCVVCGSVYHSISETSKYCSKECKRKRKDNTHRGRARHFGVEYDQSITWRTLSKKLGHCNCEICGEPCDPNDKTYGNDGPLYPSVDCIIAMANGGGYVWGNVQLAHKICNSAKRDLIDEDEIAKAVIAIAHDGGRDAQRHAAGTAKTACA